MSHGPDGREASFVCEWTGVDTSRVAPAEATALLTKAFSFAPLAFLLVPPHPFFQLPAPVPKVVDSNEGGGRQADPES